MTTTETAWRILAGVPDPEIPVISVLDLGIIRRVEVDDDHVIVDVTPTYSACPATQVIADDVRVALAETFCKVTVNTVWSPAWSTDWISEEGREKLLKYGIAPPNPANDQPRACPQCGSVNTELTSQFGSTPCKSLHRCLECQEPFDYFKCL